MSAAKIPADGRVCHDETRIMPVNKSAPDGGIRGEGEPKGVLGLEGKLVVEIYSTQH